MNKNSRGGGQNLKGWGGNKIQGGLKSRGRGGGASITFLTEFKFPTGLGSGVSSNISAEIII